MNTTELTAHEIPDLSVLRPGDTLKHKAHGEEWLVVENRPALLDVPRLVIAMHLIVIQHPNEWVCLKPGKVDANPNLCK